MTESEGAAIALIKRAVQLDTSKRYTEALVCYKEGLQLLLEVMKTIGDKEKKNKYRQKAEEYLSRSEQVQQIIDKEKQNGKYPIRYYFQSYIASIVAGKYMYNV